MYVAEKFTSRFDAFTVVSLDASGNVSGLLTDATTGKALRLRSMREAEIAANRMRYLDKSLGRPAIDYRAMSILRAQSKFAR